MGQNWKPILSESGSLLNIDSQKLQFGCIISFISRFTRDFINRDWFAVDYQHHQKKGLAQASLFCVNIRRISPTIISFMNNGFLILGKIILRR